LHSLLQAERFSVHFTLLFPVLWLASLLIVGLARNTIEEGDIFVVVVLVVLFVAIVRLSGFFDLLVDGSCSHLLLHDQVSLVVQAERLGHRIVLVGGGRVFLSLRADLELGLELFFDFLLESSVGLLKVEFAVELDWLLVATVSILRRS
jgi:hypothetical protein